MTEPRGLDCESLFHLWWFIRYRSNKRKSRLYTVACCRQIWHLFVDPACRRAVEVSERYADKMCSREELIEARRAVEAAAADGNAVAFAAQDVNSEAASWVFAAAIRTAFNRPDPNDVAQLIQQAAPDAPDLPKRQRLLFHELSGPRLFKPVPFDHRWLAWHDGAIRRMAQSVYDARAFDHLPLLADALEEAGCADPAILSHCREPGEHVRGCWVVDLLLGKT